MILKEDIVYGENAKPVVLATKDIHDNKATIVAGWQKWGGSKLISNLRFTKIMMFAIDKCEKELGDKFIKNSMLCAGIEKVGKGMCKVVIKNNF